MIGSNNYVDNIPPPTIIISDEANNNNNIHNRPTLTLYSDEQNNNCQIVDSPADVEYYSHNDHINGNFLCLSNNVINLDDIPISALRTKSRDLLSKRLNPIKVILSENGAPRDWRGVLNSVGLSDVVNTVQQTQDEMKQVLDLWMKTGKIPATIGNLQTILGNIDRWDVVDDTNDPFFDDAKYHLEVISKQKQNKSVDNQSKTLEIKECPGFVDESELLTRDDVERANSGLPVQRYDAYLLFDSDNDINFATEILTKMEGEYNLKLCTKERDFIGGTFESDAIMRMISERCDRLIVIFSKSFFESVANTFFVKFAQAISIEQRKRKIIPCMNEACPLPPQLQFYYVLRYREPTLYFNFWHKLFQSIQSAPINPSLANMPRITITEIDSPSGMIESKPQPQHATIENRNDLDTPNTITQKRKDKSKSPKSSSPSTPTSLKKLWNNFPKIGSQSTISSSMWTLGVTDNIFDKENERCHSSLSLNSNINSMNLSPTPTKYKKTKWFKKLLSPSSAKLSAESDSSVGMESTTKKKKWYRKRFRSRSKNREPTATATANEV